MLTKSRHKTKRGPKEVDAGNIYAFAHQAYWGFRFLAEKKRSFWKQIQDVQTVRAVQEVGRACSHPGAMAKAGYGAAGLMTWLSKRKIALQILNAKNHRRYPNSCRPSSQDRRMISLAIAAAAGVWGITYSTALRKLAQVGRGLEYMAREVHGFDRLKESLRRQSLVYAEPLGTYFCCLPSGKLRQMRKLPCEVPSNCRVGFIIHGYGADGPQSTYSPTLPREIADSLLSQPKTKRPAKKKSISEVHILKKTPDPNSVRSG